MSAWTDRAAGVIGRRHWRWAPGATALEVGAWGDDMAFLRATQAGFLAAWAAGVPSAMMGGSGGATMVVGVLDAIQSNLLATS